MPKRTPKGPETRPVSFRMPVAIYNDLAEVAASRGVDVSAILNWICAEYHPTLLLKRSAGLSSRPVDGLALRIVRDMLTKLQDLHETLSKRALDEGERRAG